MNQLVSPHAPFVARRLHDCGLSSAAGEKPMRIGVLCHGFGSGSSRAAIDLAQALHRCGNPTFLITLGRPRWLVPKHLHHICIAVKNASQSLEADWTPAEVARLADSIHEASVRADLDVLNYHYGFPFAQACQLLSECPAHRMPAIVATLHGGDIARAERNHAAREALLEGLDAAQAVLTVSQAYGQRLQALAASKTRCQVIPNFLPAERAAVRAPLRTVSATPNVVHVSNFKPVKNVQQCGQAFLALRRRQRCNLLLAGDGPHRRSLQALLRTCGGSVRFLGQQADSRAILARADVLLITSSAESFSLVALEAMTAGVPVVAPRLAGLSETVIDGEGGLLFTPGRPADAALKILRLIRCPELYRRISYSAQSASRRYSEARTVESYLNLFAGLCAA